MKCPKCKKAAIAIPDATHTLVKGKLKQIAGWLCEWCALSWTVQK